MSTPFTMIVDSREQFPYEFPRGVPVIRKKLDAGDYSVTGLEGHFAIERKSLDDCFSTVIADRPRFVRELERLRTYPRAFLLVEGTLRDVLDYRSDHWAGIPPAVAAGRGRSVVNSLNTWQIEYGIRVLYADQDRELCRALVLRLAERCWRAAARERESTRPGPGPAEPAPATSAPAA